MASGVELATAYVTLTASTRGMGRQVAREFTGIERQADASGKRAGKRMSAGIGASLKSLAGIGAVIGIGNFLGDALSEARESQKVGAISAQVIKTTGGAAKVTAAQVGDLATAISNKTGIDDEAIQSGSNLLLTFKNVKNEVGTGSKVFDRATQAAVDLSAAGFGSITGASKMVGKALNDPIKGMTALGRAGVTFTDQQKEQIKTLVKSGDTLGAQKIILKELESQVGGTAAASATAGDKLKTTFANFQEGIGTLLLPALDAVFTKASEFITFLTANLGPAFKAVGGFFSSITKEGTGASSFLTRTLMPAFHTVKDFIVREVVPRFLSIADAIKQFVAVAIPIVRDFVKGMIERIRPLMPTIREIFKLIGQIITGALDLIKAVIQRVTAVIAFIWQRWGQGIMDFIAVIWRKILGIIKPALETIRGLIRTFTAIFKGDWSGAWNSLKGTFSSAWKTLRGVINLAVTLLGKALSVAWSGMVTTAGRVWDGITGAIAGPLDRVMEFIQENFIDKVNGLFTFLRIPVHITPIWKPSNVGTGMRNAGRITTERRLGARGGSTRNEREPMGGAVASGAGSMVKPVNANPAFPWGRYPSGGVHRALDFPVPIGTPVRAPFSGTVVQDGWDSGGFGIHIRTRDSDGNYTILGHLSREFVSPGQAIRAGQIIGMSGSTGNSTGPHLHMERRTSLYNGASAFNFTNGLGPSSGPRFNPIAELLKNGISTIANGARGLAGRVGGPFGPLFANILERLVRGAGSRGLSMLGIEGGELRPRLYDQGGMIPPGDTLVRNLTGRPETLLPFDASGGRMFSDADLRAFRDVLYEGVYDGQRDSAAMLARVDRQLSRQRVGTA